VGWIWSSGSSKPYVPLSLSSKVKENGMPLILAQSLEEPELGSACTRGKGIEREVGAGGWV